MWKSLSWGMSTVCGQQKLREPNYQLFMLLATVAREIRRQTERTVTPFEGD